MLFLRWLHQAQGEVAFTAILGTLRSLRTLEIEAALFNYGCSGIVFTLKIAAIGAVVFCGFGAVQFIHTYTALSALYFTMVLDAFLLFNTIYDKGFAVPQKFSTIKRTLAYKIKRVVGLEDGEVKYVLKELASVKAMSIRVGTFHYLERVSTPMFLDFSVKNAARLVMAYRRR